jgi:CDP-diacylglycerol--glycerol-3-phosphate 3-phosphatidyltransferase
MVIIIVGRDVIITLLRVFADMKSYPFTTSYYAKWKTMLQMIFLYYLLILYVTQFTPEINSVYGDLISSLLNKQLIYFIALLITMITFHSGLLYVVRNWKIILKLLKIEN